MTNEEWRNHRYYKFDPFAGEIPPALLNSADIKRYVDKGCLIKKDDFDLENCLKPASYEMKFLGKLYDWNNEGDEKLKQDCREIHCGSEITLHANSITYLWMKEELMLPQYIAARFNLHIRHVHKGILLGTGPLVDPGFFGSLLIPLHNLTNNKYELKGGEGIIWIEFTKISEHEFWNQKDNRDNPPDLKSFPNKKDLADPHSYFVKSCIYRKCGVQSAFKGSLDSAQDSATKAKQNADDARKEMEQSNKQLKKFGWIAVLIGGITILLTIAGVWFTGHNLISDTVSRVQDSRNREISEKIRKQDDQLQELGTDLKEMKTRLMEVSESLNELNRQIEKPNNVETP